MGVENLQPHPFQDQDIVQKHVRGSYPYVAQSHDFRIRIFLLPTSYAGRFKGNTTFQLGTGNRTS